MQVKVGYKKPQHYRMEGSVKKLGKSLVRGKIKNLLKRLLLNDGMQKEACIIVGRVVRKEIKFLCSDTHNSIQREQSKASIGFLAGIPTVWCELQSKAPLLLLILQNCFLKSKATSDGMKAIFCMFISMLLKTRNSKMCMVQAMITLVLYAGHTEKQVSICTCACNSSIEHLVLLFDYNLQWKLVSCMLHMELGCTT